MTKKCDNCVRNVENEMLTIPYAAHQSAAARQERQIRRMWIALIVSVALIFASNAMWLWGWLQYDYTSVTEEIIYQQDGQGTNIIGDSNEVNNGTESDDTQA